MSISAGADLFRHSVAATHEEFAAELGTAREVVSRLLKDFAGAGAIEVGRGRVELRDEAILRERA